MNWNGGVSMVIWQEYSPLWTLATLCNTSRCSLSPIILELSRSILTVSLLNTIRCSSLLAPGTYRYTSASSRNHWIQTNFWEQFRNRVTLKYVEIKIGKKCNDTERFRDKSWLCLDRDNLDDPSQNRRGLIPPHYPISKLCWSHTVLCRTNNDHI